MVAPLKIGPILVVDDDDNIRALVNMALVDEGYSVLTAINGTAALKAVEQTPPALILLDMRMPVMDGWQFAQAYHQMDPPHAPIITMTAARDAAVSAQQINASGFLSKPFDIDDLIAIVHEHVSTV